MFGEQDKPEQLRGLAVISQESPNLDAGKVKIVTLWGHWTLYGNYPSIITLHPSLLECHQNLHIAKKIILKDDRLIPRSLKKPHAAMN